jgi:hypothetical protein
MRQANGRFGWLSALGTRDFHRPLSDPRADLRPRFYGSERDGRNVPIADFHRASPKTAAVDPIRPSRRSRSLRSCPALPTPAAASG